MNLNQELIKLYTYDSSRKLGRINSSDIYNILTGDLTPENFFDNQPTDMVKLKNVWRGMAIEDRFGKELEKLGFKMKWETTGEQLKYEIPVDDFVIVVKPDFHILNGKEINCKDNEFLLETKCPNRIKEDIPNWYLYQLECQYRATGIPVYLCQINVMDNDEPIVCLIKFKPSEVRWKNILAKLKAFNQELNKLYNEVCTQTKAN